MESCGCVPVPGISIDVPVLLRGLGSPGLICAARIALEARSGTPEASRSVTLPICIKSRGLTVDVVELLHSMAPKELLSAVQAAVRPYPSLQKWKVVQDLGEMDGSEMPSAPGAEGGYTGTSASSSPSTSPSKLPSIGSDDRRSADPLSPSSSKLPRLPAGPGSTKGFNSSHSTPSLPSLARQGETSVAAAERDARQLSERLRRVIRNKDIPATQALLVARADMEQRDRDGSNAASLAMLQGTPHSILRVLLEAHANVHAIDGQGRSLAHLWAWTLPKTKLGVREAQKKLLLLVKSKANLNSQLPVTGDTPLHILARVFNTLSARASDGQSPGAVAGDEIGGQKETEQFASCTQSRIQLMIGSGASTSARNGEGKKPLALISPRFQNLLLPLTEGDASTGTEGVPEASDTKLSLSTKGRCLKVVDEDLVGADCLE